jgi:triphosphoribosyl-dephospho-CoA synthase
MTETIGPGECARLACVWEVTARKAGNVHPGRDFANLHFSDFLASAAAIAPAFDRAADVGVGHTVLDAIRATRAVVATNTNLGIVLLLAPLAAVPLSRPLRPGLSAILANLTVEDARHVFAAIRLAQPGGLGKAASEDVAGEPTLPLRQIMTLAAQRDLVARQYDNGFQEVFEVAVPALCETFKRCNDLEQAIVFTHLTILATHPDSLIARKRGAAEADEASRRALRVLQTGWPETTSARAAFAELDAWLITMENSRNPGTSADVTTAALFVALREKLLSPRSFA